MARVTKTKTPATTASAETKKTTAKKVAAPKEESFYDQIVQFPCETQWYGEFLLHDQTIPIIPREPLFKVWGFEEQWKEGISLGETDEVLTKNYLGVVDQSYWSRSLDALTKSQQKKIKWKKRLNRLVKKFKHNKCRF